ncbi:hypothetical protein BD626DRAFT_565399 [Schizophyllum amplum]|uniref:Uncharacterized protein n=1 Tax=Schizophyllum amplum TaxID=97359 RepID=A0A550CUV0_9AGAR|nr:hypothetical protein BD626DRAFT_565399 [Auriculariopsis ampla]
MACCSFCSPPGTLVKSQPLETLQNIPVATENETVVEMAASLIPDQQTNQGQFEAQPLSERCLPYMVLPPSRRIVSSFVTALLEEAIPESTCYHDVSYAVALYPCYSSAPSAKILPKFRVASSILTMPVNLAERCDTVTTPGVSTSLPNIRGLMDEAQGSNFSGAMDIAEECTASEGAVAAPSIPNETAAEVIDIHLAHAPSGSPQNHSLGVFDLSDKSSARALACFLLEQRSQFYSSVTFAQARAHITRTIILNPEYKTWRADFADENNDDNTDTLHRKTANVRRWRQEVSVSNIRDQNQASASIRHLSDLGQEIEDLIMETSDECGYPLIFPMAQDWDNISSLASETLSSDAKALAILGENGVRPYAWPSPDMPKVMAGIETLRSICENYLLCFDFGQVSHEGTYIYELSEADWDTWDRFCKEIEQEKNLRNAAKLPDLQTAQGGQIKMLRILPAIRQLCRNARATIKAVSARQSWDTLLATCLQGKSFDQYHTVHIRSDQDIPLPRSAHCDSVHGQYGSQWDVQQRYTNSANGTLTLHWDNPTTTLSAAATAAPSWLHESKLALETLIAKEYGRRVHMVSVDPSLGGGDTHYTDVRVLDAEPFVTCDTVACVSILDVFDVDPTDTEGIQQIEDFRIIGRSAARPGDRPMVGSNRWSRSEALDSNCLVNDPVLREVRQMIAGMRDIKSSHPPAATAKAVRRHRPLDDRIMDQSLGDDNRVESLRSIQLPCIWLEDTTQYTDFTEAFSQARYRLLSSVRFYAALGIYDLEVFAVATVGSYGHLLCGWGTKEEHDSEYTDVLVNIADINCPIWDLRDCSQIIRFFMNDVRAERASQCQRWEEIQAEIDRLKRDVEHIEETVKLQDLYERWPGLPFPEDMSRD